MVAAALCCLLTVSCGPAEPFTKVVAHRGHWKAEGAAQNSLSSLRAAAELGVYGSEFDVNMTSDGVLVVNHDFTIQGYNIHETPYDTLKDLVLSNGETLPTFEQYLEAALEYPSLKLVFEVKSAGDSLYEARYLPPAVETLRKYGVLERTEFISFSLSACRALARMCPDNMVEYLGGTLSPSELLPMGIRGIDYHFSVFDKHPEWVSEAHGLGMICNAWTVDKEEDINRMLSLGVDFITTNNPREVDSLRHAFVPAE